MKLRCDANGCGPSDRHSVFDSDRPVGWTLENFIRQHDGPFVKLPDVVLCKECGRPLP